MMSPEFSVNIPSCSMNTAYHPPIQMHICTTYLIWDQRRKVFLLILMNTTNKTKTLQISRDKRIRACDNSHWINEKRKKKLNRLDSIQGARTPNRIGNSHQTRKELKLNFPFDAVILLQIIIDGLSLNQYNCQRIHYSIQLKLCREKCCIAKIPVFISHF